MTLGLAYDDDGLIVAQCFCSSSISKRGHFLHGVVTQDDESLSVETQVLSTTFAFNEQLTLAIRAFNIGLPPIVLVPESSIRNEYSDRLRKNLHIRIRLQLLWPDCSKPT